MNHIEFGLLETINATQPTAWEAWFAAVEAGLGHSLDGDDSFDARSRGCSDGYSIDCMYVIWERRKPSAQKAVAFVRAQKACAHTLRAGVSRLSEFDAFLNSGL